MIKILIFLSIIFSLDAEARKIIVSNTNAGGPQYRLIEIIGQDVPPEYLMDAPEEAQSLEDLDINFEKKIALVNNEKVAVRLALEADKRAAINQKFEDDKAEIINMKAVLDKIDGGVSSLSAAELRQFLKIVKKRLGL